MYESAFPPIGVTGATVCSLFPQVSSINFSNSSTRASSTPHKKVVLPDLKNPPVDASLVFRKSFLLIYRSICGCRDLAQLQLPFS